MDANWESRRDRGLAQVGPERCAGRRQRRARRPRRRDTGAPARRVPEQPDLGLPARSAVPVPSARVLPDRPRPPRVLDGRVVFVLADSSAYRLDLAAAAADGRHVHLIAGERRRPAFGSARSDAARRLIPLCAEHPIDIHRGCRFAGWPPPSCGRRPRGQARSARAERRICGRTGACAGNPGPGGWAAILVAAGHTRELSGGDPDTTNNRQELTACIEGLRALTRRCVVTIHTDSTYVLNAFRRAGRPWRRRAWKTRAGTPVANRDLWEQLEAAVAAHDVSWQWHEGSLRRRAERALRRAGVRPARRAPRRRWPPLGEPLAQPLRDHPQRPLQPLRVPGQVRPGARARTGCGSATSGRPSASASSAPTASSRRTPGASSSSASVPTEITSGAGTSSSSRRSHGTHSRTIAADGRTSLPPRALAREAAHDRRDVEAAVERLLVAQPGRLEPAPSRVPGRAGEGLRECPPRGCRAPGRRASRRRRGARSPPASTPPGCPPRRTPAAAAARAGVRPDRRSPRSSTLVVSAAVNRAGATRSRSPPTTSTPSRSSRRRARVHGRPGRLRSRRSRRRSRRRRGPDPAGVRQRRGRAPGRGRVLARS